MESLLFYLENSCGLAHPGSQRTPADFGKESCRLEGSCSYQLDSWARRLNNFLMSFHPSRTIETQSETIRGKRIRKHFQMMVFYAERIVRKREMTKCQKGLTG